MSDPIEARLAAIEARLAVIEARPWQMPAKLLRGIRAISQYTGLAEGTLHAYRRNEGFPIFRWGRHAVLVPEMLGPWFASREPHQAARRAAKQSGIDR
jgi:hypothetical protein